MVRLVAMVIIKITTKFELFIIINSIIASFEKNPAINGNPIKAKLLIFSEIVVNGIFCQTSPSKRKSWLWWLK